MSNIRFEILEAINHKAEVKGYYEQLKDCLILDKSSQPIVELDKWMNGVVGSLFYVPNRYGLLMVGPQGVGKSEFVRRLLPNRLWYTDRRMPYAYSPNIYDFLICDMTDFGTKVIKEVQKSSGFRVAGVNADKRLASVYVSHNTSLPNLSLLKSWVTLNVANINTVKYNSIPKLELWIEIFNLFAMTHKIRIPINKNDIIDYFKQA